MAGSTRRPSRPLWYDFYVKKRLLKLAAVLLLLALPLQAFAAASMLFCGRITHDTWLGQTVKALSDQHGDQLAQVAHQNDGDHHDGFVGHHHDGNGNQIKHLAESCSTCSDCCCPTTLPSAERTSLAFADSLSTLIPFVTQPIPDSALERLERPPRNSLV
jgi:hypothetical protein